SAGCTNIGIASNHAPVHAATDADADVEAADVYDHIVNWTFAEPVLLGKYPADELAALLPDRSTTTSRHRATAGLVGINYYEPTLIAAPREGEGSEACSRWTCRRACRSRRSHSTVTREPISAGRSSRRAHGDPDDLPGPVRRGPSSVYITESGCSFHDPDPDAAGRVRDERRIAYHADHLTAVRAAMDAGVDVRGYFVWSILDNFEWAAGYRERFGLVHVDYDTLARTPKDSYRWFQSMLAARKGA
ncbi:family 1 glycosylhydrolase, partial [Rhodococcus hoagii]|nr:family 1 glycosylhydrolase [Prescottella equi]